MLEPKKIDPRRLPEVVRAKWPNDQVLDEGFVPLPKRVVRCLSQLFAEPESIERLAILLAVVDYQRPNLMRPPSIEYLASLAGLELDRFRHRLEEMEHMGWVTKAGPDEVITIRIEGFMNAVLAETE